MDIKLSFENDVNFWEGRGDINFDSNDVVVDYGLTTAVLTSIYTDKRALKDDDIPDGTTNRRGWWGDTVADIEGDNIGSRLWLLSRSKTTNDVLNKAQNYLEECIEWMIEDDIVAEIDVITERILYAIDGSYVLGAQIDMLRQSGEKISFKFDDLWKAQFSIS